MHDGVPIIVFMQLLIVLRGRHKYQKVFRPNAPRAERTLGGWWWLMSNRRPEDDPLYLYGKPALQIVPEIVKDPCKVHTVCRRAPRSNNAV